MTTTTTTKTQIDLARLTPRELAAYHTGMKIVAARRAGRQTPTMPREFSALTDVLTTARRAPARKFTLHRLSAGGLFA
jgi:hypothetical protein